MKKLKIALFYPWLKSRGGGERLVLEFIKKSKHNVDVYTWVFLPNKTYEEFSKLNVIVVGPHLFEKNANSFLLRGFLGLFSALFSKIQLSGYDALLIITGGIAEFITFRNKIAGATLLYTLTPLRVVHDSYDYTKSKMKGLLKYFFAIATKFYKILEMSAYKKADYIFTLSKLVKKRIVDAKLCPNTKIEVIYPGVDFESFKTGRYENYFFYPSRITESKQQLLVIDAFKIFEQKYPNYKLILIGSTRDEAYLKKVTTSAKGHNITILLDISDSRLVKLYSNCLASLFYPLREDWGLVPFEAMASGKFVLGINEGGYTELFKNKQNGLLTNTNPNEISKAMEWIIKHKKTVITIGKHNKKISKKYDWRFFVDRLDKSIERNIIVGDIKFKKPKK